MSINYTEDQVKYMTDLYSANPTRETVEKLSKELDKSAKSIIGKLSREGVYKKTVYKTKAGEDPITKKELVQEIAGILDMSADSITGLEKSPKTDLNNLVSMLRELEARGEEGTDGLQLIWRGE
tara:strand:- start:208 stop:579 length:372 start_codon:yes stop_codon:yes gene_type:complete